MTLPPLAMPLLYSELIPRGGWASVSAILRTCRWRERCCEATHPINCAGLHTPIGRLICVTCLATCRALPDNPLYRTEKFRISKLAHTFFGLP